MSLIAMHEYIQEREFFALTFDILLAPTFGRTHNITTVAFQFESLCTVVVVPSG
jgi:hypothetical protein